MNKNSGLSELSREQPHAALLLFISVYLPSYWPLYVSPPSPTRSERKSSGFSERRKAKWLAGWLAAARAPKKKKSSSRLLRKKRGTVGPREHWITKVDFPLRQERNKFVAHPLRSHPPAAYTPSPTPVVLSFPPVSFGASPRGSRVGR